MPEKAIITLKVDPEVKDAVMAEAARRGVSATALVVEFIKGEIPIRPPAPIPGQVSVEEAIEVEEIGLRIAASSAARGGEVETFSPDCPNRAYHQLTMHCRVCGGYRT